ncbi:MAG: YncE family protein [Acidobacteria bacterium]|nr:YncE family protein [Acidobacteriota bacterium]
MKRAIIWAACLFMAAAVTATEIKVGQAPNFIRLTSDGEHAVVTNFGSDEISLISLKSMRQIRKVPGGYGPLGIAVEPAGRRVYVTNMESGLVKAFTLPILELEDTFKVGHVPTDLCLTPDGYHLLIANYGKGKWGRLDIFDLQKQRVIESVKVGLRPQALAVNPAGDTVYVANSAESTVSVISLDVNKVIDTLKVGDGPNGLAISRNGRKLYITHSRSNDLWVWDLRRGQVLHKVPMPEGPFRFSLSPDEKWVAVACYRAGEVAVLDADIAGEPSVRRIPVRKSPVDAVFTADASRILVTCEGDEKVLVVPAPAAAPKPSGGGQP